MKFPSLKRKVPQSDEKKSTSTFVIYLYLTTIVLIAIAVGYTTWFLYFNFFQTLGQEQEIILLRREVAFVMVDTKAYSRTEEKMLEKQTLKEITESEIKNYFEPY